MTAIGKGRRLAAYSLVVVASALVVIGVLAAWINRVALDNQTYTDTSSAVLRQPEVQHALSIYLVDQLYSNVDVAAQIQPLLPNQAQGLAGPASALLRDYAQRAAQRLLQSDAIQQVWREVNQRANARLITVIEGGGPRVSSKGGDVVLNTGPLIERLAGLLGVQTPAAFAGGQIVILRSNQLSLVQTAAKWLERAAWGLVFVVVGLYAVAIYLARGRRRETVRACGIGMLIAGLVLLIGRRTGGGVLVNQLATLPDARAAASAAWDVLVSDLADATITIIAIGLLAVIWAWLAGDGDAGRSVRRALSPIARHTPARLWVGFVVVMLLWILWAPTEAARRVIPVLVITMLAAVGLEALRRQSVADFPDARPIAIRDRFGRPRRVPATDDHARVSELERLAALQASGALDPEEFQLEKRRVLVADLGRDGDIDPSGR